MEITPGWETVEMTMDPSGFVEARIGASPHGQGLRTTLAQIVADEVGRRPGPHQRRSMATPIARPMAGARSPAARWSLPAAQRCWPRASCERKLIRIAGHLLEASAEDIVLEAGPAKVAGTDRALPIETLARAAYHQIPSLRRRDRARSERDRDLRSARHLLQCLPRGDRRGRHRDRRVSGSSSSWWPRTPAASSIR